MKTVLFQGDSITDCGRDREDTQEFGAFNKTNMLAHGYAFMAATALGAEEPNKYRFLNRGIGGNCVSDILARARKDIITLKPDCMSLLVGVNDAYDFLCYGTGLSEREFEKNYDLLLSQVFEALPDIKIMLFAPFIVDGSFSFNTPEIPDKRLRLQTAVERYAAVVDKLGQKYSLPVVHLQEIFDEAIKKSGDVNTWVHDGIHPTSFGHRLIADAWLKTFKEL